MTGTALKISSLGQLKEFLGKYTMQGYHIDFDAKGNTIVMLYPGDFDYVSTELKFRLHPIAAEHVQVVELSITRRLKNWITRQQKRFA
jgi:hypothetical protein